MVKWNSEEKWNQTFNSWNIARLKNRNILITTRPKQALERVGTYWRNAGDFLRPIRWDRTDDQLRGNSWHFPKLTWWVSTRKNCRRRMNTFFLHLILTWHLLTSSIIRIASSDMCRWWAFKANPFSSVVDDRLLSNFSPNLLFQIVCKKSRLEYTKYLKILFSVSYQSR